MLLLNKDNRSKNAAYGSMVSLILKIASIVVSFFSIPVVLDFVSKETFGVWLVISSSFAIINVLDFGLGDGLRNKFAEAKAMNNVGLQKKYVSTTYFTNLILSLVIIGLFFIVDGFISWSKVFNLSQDLEFEVNSATRIAIIFTSLQFFLQAILNLLKGDQRFAQASIIGFILNLLSLISIIAVKILGLRGDLSLLVIAYFAVPNITLLIVSIYLFLTRYRNIRPSIKFIKACHVKELMTLSTKFFIINVLGIVSLQIINILVIREFSASIVTDFNLLYRYYFFLIAVATILFNPLWSAFTDALVKRDDLWVRQCLTKCYRYTIILLLSIPIFVLLSNKFICYWSGHTFHSSLAVNMLFGLWVAVVIVTEPIKMLIKGGGELNSYLRISILSTAAQVLISLVLIKTLHLNIAAILIGVVINQLSVLYILIREKNKMLFALTTVQTP
jgi:O-antigen/teichoic acid export membrane protein